MKVEKIYSKSITKINKDASLIEAAKFFFQQQVSCLLVVNDSDELVGILSEKDLYKALYPDYKDYYLQPEIYLDYELMETRTSKIKHWTVSKIMNTKLYTVSENDPLMKVGAIMLAKRINRLPVLDSNGKLIGVVNRREIYQEIFKKEFYYEK